MSQVFRYLSEDRLSLVHIVAADQASADVCADVISEKKLSTFGSATEVVVNGPAYSAQNVADMKTENDEIKRLQSVVASAQAFLDQRTAHGVGDLGDEAAALQTYITNTNAQIAAHKVTRDAIRDTAVLANGAKLDS